MALPAVSPETQPASQTHMPSGRPRPARWCSMPKPPSSGAPSQRFAMAEPSSTKEAPGGRQQHPSHPQRRPARSRRIMPAAQALLTPSTLLAVLVLATLVAPAAAVKVQMTNCLSESTQHDNPLRLQWVPMWAEASFAADGDTHTLLYKVWGDVTGAQNGDYKNLADPGNVYWSDVDQINGKIARSDSDGKLATTLFRRADVVTYEPINDAVDFCQDALTNASCPLTPLFNKTPIALPENLWQYSSMNITHNFSSSYAFASFATTLLLINGDLQATNIGCISSILTPSLGDIAAVIKFVPLAILILVGFAVVFAGNFSPWGSTDIFQWSSNYGRDADQLRLVTPGFGDCLQYLQFVVLTGALTLSYPGYYQPVVSQAGWSSIMFNESLVTDKPGYQAVIDGLYIVDGRYGLEKVGKLIGMADDQDIWAGMMVWLCVIIAATFVAIQIGFVAQWVYRKATNNPEEDLRAKNIPFSIGNVVRIVFNFMLLPVVALSAYQLVIAKQAPSYTIALAAITLVVVIGFAVYMLYLIVTTRPKSVLFDDLPIVLRYGPLYNTFSDDAAAFALIPILLQITRGLAIGAVQPSGVAQVVLLAICEVVQIFTLHAVKPFHSPTSMNAYHTGFSCLRLVTILLMVAFVPSLGVDEGAKGWIGYAILLVHGCVLVFGFFLSAIQTIVEVIARMLGAGVDDGTGQTRGGLSKIFGLRQLNKREPHRPGPSRASQLSTSAMIDAEKASRSGYMMANGRVRSTSGASLSAMAAANRNRTSSALDSIDIYSNAQQRTLDSPTSYIPGTPGEASTFSFIASPNTALTGQGTLAALEAADPYYRPPRRRRDTLGGDNSPLETSPLATGPGALGIEQDGLKPPGPPGENIESGADISRGTTPAPPGALPGPGGSNTALGSPPNRPDYSTREVDFYYGVRGPALNSEFPGRKLGTGPADPTGPIATATGWFRNMFGGKGKDKAKGFEVVRSSRMPPAMARNVGFGDETPPEGIPVAMGVLRNGPIDSDDEDDPQPKTSPKRAKKQGALLTHEGDPQDSDAEEPVSPVSDHDDREDISDDDAPHIPRKSSKRDSGQISSRHMPSLSMVESHDGSMRGHRQSQSLSSVPRLPNLPFERPKSQNRLSMASSMDMANDFTDIDLEAQRNERPASFGVVRQHPISRIDPKRSRELLGGSQAELVDENGEPKQQQ